MSEPNTPETTEGVRGPAQKKLESDNPELASQLDDKMNSIAEGFSVALLVLPDEQKERLLRAIHDLSNMVHTRTADSGRINKPERIVIGIKAANAVMSPWSGSVPAVDHAADQLREAIEDSEKK